MKQIVAITISLLFCASTLFAQEVEVVEEVEVEQTQEKPVTPAFNHWSIAIGGGMTLFDGDQHQQRHEFFPNSSILAGGLVSVEYDFNPRIGLFAMYSMLPVMSISTYYPVEFNQTGSQRIKSYSYVHNMSLNVSMNLTNLFGKCYRNPKWAVYFNTGIGVGIYNISVFNLSEDQHDYGLSYRGGYAGFIPVGLSLEYTPVRWLGISWDNFYNFYMEDDLESSIKGNSDDGIFYSGLGIRFKIATKNHRHMRNISWCEYADKKDNLQQQIDQLKKRADNTDEEIAAIKDEIEKLKNVKPEAPAMGLTEADVERMIGVAPSQQCEPAPIYFNINSYKFNEQADLSIAHIAQKMYDDKNLNLTLKGYCDYTGTESYNEKLSLERAEAVKNVLVNTYGVDANRISVKGMGRTMGPKDNYLPNRRVDFVFENK